MRVDDLPPTHEYWERPPSKDAGDPNTDNLYMMVGRCLSRWEKIEEEFADLFETFVAVGSHAAKRAYGSIVSAGGRRDALKAAAEVFFYKHPAIPQIEQKRFKALLDHFAVASGKRNEIAHGIVENFTIHVGPRQAGGCFLFPAGYNSNKTKAFREAGDIENLWSFVPGKYRYIAADLSYFYVRFAALDQATDEYTVDLKREYLTH